MTTIAYCTICDKERETKYIDLFVIGSEGTRLCHDCEMRVVEFIRSQMSVALQQRIERR